MRANLIHSGSVLILSISVVIIFLMYRDALQDQSISNNITLIIEILIGCGIAIILSWISKLNEVKLNVKINKMDEILRRTEKDRSKKETETKRSIYLTLQKIDNIVGEVLSEYDIQNEQKSRSEKSKEKIRSLCAELEKLSKLKLDDPIKMIIEFFSNDDVKDIKNISDRCKFKPNFSIRNPIADPSHYNEMQSKISKINKHLEDTYRDYSTYHTFTVSTDRSVYPLKSKIYVQANIPYAVDGDSIKFEIFNNKEKQLVVKTINIESKYLTHPDSGIYEIDFKMDGDVWKIHESYTARATYADKFEEGSFAIDQRIPTIQADKGVYAIGSDMIISVIDPDSDKDSNAIENVGDRKESHITIKSRHGSIDGYKLEETGNSTGIFRGVIGVLGMRTDGTMTPYNTGDEIIEKTQGTGGEDGYIAVRPGDKIILSYHNGSKTVSAPYYVSEFIPSVELDKKVYKPNDKMEISVVDPDHNYGIQNNEEEQRVITADVKIGSNIINTCQLLEIGPGVGAFTGKVSLKERTNDQPDSQDEGDSSDAMPCCRDGDPIIVTYTSFLGDSSTAEASIQA